MYTDILFDLDGTLTDSAEGITKSVQYALSKVGHDEEDLEKLKVFVGPPLKEMFKSYAHLSDETALLCIDYFRERYAPIGAYENRVYDGVKEMLSRLLEKGYRLSVASSKPEPFVKKILDHFGLTDYFSVITGSSLDQSRTTKSEVLRENISRLGLSAHKERCILVGDRKHDVAGAREEKIDCLGVTYGYGSFEELQEAGATAIVSSPEEVADFFC